MNTAMTPLNPARKSFFSTKRCGLLLVVFVTYLAAAMQADPVFNDDNYADLRHHLEMTIALPEGSPEQAVAYLTLGKHLGNSVYGKLNGMDVVHWVRDANNPLRPLFRLHPQLANDWDTKGDDGLSNADHYRGFAAGPVSAARVLFQESAPGNMDRLNALLTRHAGTDLRLAQSRRSRVAAAASAD